jgi:hypothetical protein
VLILFLPFFNPLREEKGRKIREKREKREKEGRNVREKNEFCKSIMYLILCNK